MKGRQRVGEAFIRCAFPLPRIRHTRVEMLLFLFLTLADSGGRIYHGKLLWRVAGHGGYLDLTIELSASCPQPLSKTRG